MPGLRPGLAARHLLLLRSFFRAARVARVAQPRAFRSSARTLWYQARATPAATARSVSTRSCWTSKVKRVPRRELKDWSARKAASSTRDQGDPSWWLKPRCAIEQREVAQVVDVAGGVVEERDQLVDRGPVVEPCERGGSGRARIGMRIPEQREDGLRHGVTVRILGPHDGGERRCGAAPDSGISVGQQLTQARAQSGPWSGQPAPKAPRRKRDPETSHGSGASSAATKGAMCDGVSTMTLECQSASSASWRPAGEGWRVASSLRRAGHLGVGRVAQQALDGRLDGRRLHAGVLVAHAAQHDGGVLGRDQRHALGVARGVGPGGQAGRAAPPSPRWDRCWSRPARAARARCRG
jgi:hypothetical protein